MSVHFISFHSFIHASHVFFQHYVHLYAGFTKLPEAEPKKKRPGRQHTGLPPWRFCSPQELTWSPGDQAEESSPRVIRWIQVHQQSKNFWCNTACWCIPCTLIKYYIHFTSTIDINEGHCMITLSKLRETSKLRRCRNMALGMETEQKEKV